MFVVLLRLSSSLARAAKISNQRKGLSLNNKPCMVRPTFTDLNPVEINVKEALDLLAIILLLIIPIICYHYAKHSSKLRNILLC